MSEIDSVEGLGLEGRGVEENLWQGERQKPCHAIMVIRKEIQSRDS